MKNTILCLSLLAIFSLACSNTGSDKNTLKVATGSESERYQCPMKCEGDTSYSSAGTCPVCEMDLQKI